MPDATTQRYTDPRPIRPRASPTDREAAARALRAALADGMLSVPEFEQRCEAAYTAVYQDELSTITIDGARTATCRDARSLRTRARQVTRPLAAFTMSLLMAASRYPRTTAVNVAVAFLFIAAVSALTAGLILIQADHG